MSATFKSVKQKTISNYNALQEPVNQAKRTRSRNRKITHTVKRIMESLQKKEYIRRVDGKRYGKWEVLV